jgi:hypothetical protein
MSESRKAFENTISVIPDGLVDKKALMEKTSVFWDFQDYVMAKYSLTEKESEEKFKSYIFTKMAATPEKMSDPSAYLEHLRLYAVECGFTSPDKLVEGFQYMTDLNAKIKMSED